MTSRPLLLLALALTGCFAPDLPATGPVAPASDPFLDPRVTRAPVSAAIAPVAISGGTLLVAGNLAVVADPDRDRIVLVDLGAAPPAVLRSTTDLPAGAEPGRSVMDSHGYVHTVLRGTGELYSFNPESAAPGARRAVCPEPRGVAYDPATDALHVACRGGELVTLLAAGGAPTRTVQLDRDLRDVVLGSGGSLFVTRFRTAELLQVGADGSILGRARPQSAVGFQPDGSTSTFEPSVAWRALPLDGRVVMVHQRGRGESVAPEPGGYGSTGERGTPCDSSIVQSSVTVFGGMSVSDSLPNLSGATLPVDLAFDADRSQFAVVAAGNQSGDRSVLVYAPPRGTFGGDCNVPQRSLSVPNATSVAFAANRTLVVLSRDFPDSAHPGARLALVDVAGTVRWVDLGGGSRFDTGHSVFHGNSGAFLACASCHPEGGDDGRVWQFEGMGPRRTPGLHGDLLATAPFHWAGDEADMHALVHDVFTGRMSGPSLSGGQIDALGRWLDEQPAPVPSPAIDPAAVDRGRTLFHGTAACATCHSGALLTNNRNYDVGTGGSFQVPSLIGVSARLPVMHDGCALTLAGRFEPGCGGQAHGAVSALRPSDIGDLVAYLETL